MDSGQAAQKGEDCFDSVIGEGIPSAGSEESRVLPFWTRQLPSSLRIGVEFVRQARAYRYQAGLKKLGVSDDNQAFGEIHVSQRERDGFADAQACTIKSKE
jgi:hypothetical protein